MFFANAGSKKKSPASAADFPQRKPIAKTKANIAAISAADLNFRVTTLLADSMLPTSHCRPVPHSSGGLFLLTVDIRPRLLGIAFDRSCSQGIANPCLAAVLHDRRLSVSGDTDTSCPVQSIWLLNNSYNRPLFAVCQPDRRRKMQFWQHLQIRQY